MCSNFVFLRSREKYSDLKRLFSNPYESSVSTLTITDARFGLDYIEYPKKKIDPLTIKLLTENPQNQVGSFKILFLNLRSYYYIIKCSFHFQYNLVCNTILKVCECNDTDKLNEIAILCCEFTAQCNSLSAEWLCALTALCNAGGSSAYQVGNKMFFKQELFFPNGNFSRTWLIAYLQMTTSFIIDSAFSFQSSRQGTFSPYNPFSST